MSALDGQIASSNHPQQGVPIMAVSQAAMRRRSRIMRVVNVPMRAALSLPFATPLSGNLMLISYTGRKSGKAYRQPVSYVRDGDVLLTAWVRRAAGHPEVAAVLAAGEITESVARTICTWTDKLPQDCREDADAILLGAAAGGAEHISLADLMMLEGSSALLEEWTSRVRA